MKRMVHVLVVLMAFAFGAVLASAQPERAARAPLDRLAVERLSAETAAVVSIHPATGTARFVRFPQGAAVTLGGQARTAAAAQDRHGQSLAFLREYGGAFGLRGEPASALTLVGQSSDSLGGEHLTYAQSYRGVPVFAGMLRTHFGPDGSLAAISGTLVPEINVDPTPSVGQQAAGGAALAVVSDLGASNLAVRSIRLLVFRTGLMKGVEGRNHLAWEVEVGNGEDVRELVYVSAHTAKVLDRINAIQDALNRRAYNTTANFPATPFWVEGDAFPTADPEANNVIQFAGETYDMYSDAFGRDSYDGAGATMETVFRRTESCPNASWNGIFTSYCAGVSPDDVVGHEWTHAYTQFTHGLIYAWQPGALNESYSDIYGEVVDFLNGTGSDFPGGNRTEGVCSAFTAFPPVVRVNSPASIAGVYPAGSAAFGPALTEAGLTGDVVLVNDGVGAGVPPALSTTDGCETPFVNAADIAGKIAMVDRGTCGFVLKVKNAQLNGAVGVIVGNHSVGGNGTLNMAGVDPTITIPSAFIGYSNANLIKAELAAGVNATLRLDAPAQTDDSYRWLVGEDATAFGGAIRDMWEPTCYGHPGKVSDAEYFCATGDNGGVHVNSGVPNHGFSLLVDGGTYNGQTVGAIGMVKAAHIYFRAMTVYQGPASDFADHADALEQSCSDLVGAPLNSLSGGPSGEVISPADCAEIGTMIEAVEMRLPPTQCNFQPLLAQNAPNQCEADTDRVSIFKDDFETQPVGWTATHTTPSGTFTPRDWEWVGTLPDRDGSAFFGIDPDIGACSAASDESGVLHLASPSISLASGVVAPRLTFEHWVATEAGWDGGNLKVSVGGGAWQLVAPADFTFNPYNTTLFTAAQGNTDPLAGQPAFSGTDGGKVEGSWGRSHVNLAPYVGPNQSFQMQWDLGTDGCTGFFGWYVDDVNVYTCTSQAKPTVSINDVAVTEGNSGFTDAVFTVTLSHAIDEPVKIRYRVKEGTAREGSDYIVGGDDDCDDDDHFRGHDCDDDDDDDDLKLVIPPLSVSGQITVRVRGDMKKENDETFFVVLSRPRNATLADGVGKGTILNDDLGGKHITAGPARGSQQKQ